MNRLETSKGEELSKILKELSPIQYTSNRQVNRLLDGSYHIQIIGNPLRSIEGIIISTFTQAESLNYLIDQGMPVVFIHMDKKYIVYIEESIQWKRINFAGGDRDKSFLEGKIKMNIKEEVAS